MENLFKKPYVYYGVGEVLKSALFLTKDMVPDNHYCMIRQVGEELILACYSIQDEGIETYAHAVNKFSNERDERN